MFIGSKTESITAHDRHSLIVFDIILILLALTIGTTVCAIDAPRWQPCHDVLPSCINDLRPFRHFDFTFCPDLLDAMAFDYNDRILY
jgi:hypothetical protein